MERRGDVFAIGHWIRRASSISRSTISVRSGWYILHWYFVQDRQEHFFTRLVVSQDLVAVPQNAQGFRIGKLVVEANTTPTQRKTYSLADLIGTENLATKIN